MKVIFLDFDGVLNNWNYANPWLGSARLLDGYVDRDRFGLLFDTDCVSRLQRLMEETGAGVVVSSSWRYLGLERMQAMWQVRALPGEVLGVIPEVDRQTTGSLDSLMRGECVQLWLDENPVDNYVIIDDTDDFLNYQRPRLVLTNYDLGFQDADLERALRILSR